MAIQARPKSSDICVWFAALQLLPEFWCSKLFKEFCGTSILSSLSFWIRLDPRLLGDFVWLTGPAPGESMLPRRAASQPFWLMPAIVAIGTILCFACSHLPTNCSVIPRLFAKRYVADVLRLSLEAVREDLDQRCEDQALGGGQGWLLRPVCSFKVVDVAGQRTLG